MPSQDGPAAPHPADRGRHVDARGARVGSVGDHNTNIITFHEARRVEWRVWFVAPVAAAAGLVWLIAAAAALGVTAAWLAAGAVAVAVLAGLTVWQTVRIHARQRGEARAARDEALGPLELPPLPFGVQSVSTLIAPERALAPLESRRRDLQDLLDWCLDPDAPLARIVDGPSGVGKTRLAVETGRALPDNWVAGRCVPGRAVDVLPLVQACAESALIVVDDADTHPDIPRLIEQLVTQTARQQDRGQVVRVLLVVRDSAAFTRSQQGHVRGAVAADWPTTTLLPIGEPSDRRRWYAHAVAAYARATDTAVPPGLDTDRRRVGEPDEAMVLTQVRAALTALADNPAEADGYRTASVDQLAAALVEHERERWQEAATDPRWKLPGTLTSDGCDEAILTLIALAPGSRDEATAALKQLTDFSNTDNAEVGNVARWAHHVYPGTTTNRGWVDPTPDFVLGALLSHLASDEQVPVVASLDLANVALHRPAVLLRLTRAAAQFSRVSALVESVLTNRPELVTIVVEYALLIAGTDLGTRTTVLSIVSRHPEAPRFQWRPGSPEMCSSRACW